MKRILYIAAMASLLMTSCQKTDVLNVVEDTIDFSTQVGKLTKADTDYSADKYSTLKAQGFRVWTFADFTLGNDTDGMIYRGMNGLDVLYSEGWGIEGRKKYFWPQSGKYLQFYTLSSNDESWLKTINSQTHLLPAVTADNNDAIPPKSTEVTGLDLPEYTVKSDAADDIMVADHIHQDKSQSKTVSPLFRHTMTKVEFNFKAGGEASETDAEEASVIILKGITTDPLINKGSLEVTYSTTDSAKPFTFDWDENDTSKVVFSATPTNVLTIVKKGGAVLSTVDTAPTADSGNDGDLCVLVADNSRTIYSCSKNDDATSATWTVVETHTYSETDKVWKSDKDTDNDANTKAAYETIVGTVLTGTSENFVTWYMIPQSIDLVENEGSEAGRVKIAYVADGVHIEQYFGLKGSNVTTWDEELCVKYNVTIAPHKIQFSPTVGEWDPYDSNHDKDGDQDIDMVN